MTKSEAKKPLVNGVERALPDAPFDRKKLTWSAELAEATVALALQRPWITYAVELGVQPNGFVNPFYAFRRDDVSTYGLRVWVKFLAADDFDDSFLNLDVEMDAAVREEKVAEYIGRFASPFLERFATVDALRPLTQKRPKGVTLHPALQAWLDAPEATPPP